MQYAVTGKALTHKFAVGVQVAQFGLQLLDARTSQLAGCQALLGAQLLVQLLTAGLVFGHAGLRPLWTSLRGDQLAINGGQLVLPGKHLRHLFAQARLQAAQ